MLVVSAALAVDLGHQMLLRRDLQKVADAIALDMVRQLDGSAPQDYNTVGGSKRTGWDAAWAASAARNDFTPSGARTLDVEAGCYDQSTQAFDTSNATCTSATAARVIAADEVKYFFYPGSGTSSRTGIAAQTPTLDYEVGSFLVGTSPDAGQLNILNGVLGKALCPPRAGSTCSTSPLTLTAVGYDGLANASVSARQISTQMGLASPDQLFTGTVNARDFFNVTADAMAANGASSATVDAARLFATQVDPTTQFDFSSVVDPGTAISGVPATAPRSTPSSRCSTCCAARPTRSTARMLCRYPASRSTCRTSERLTSA